MTREVQIAKWAMSAPAFTVIAGKLFSLMYMHLKLGSGGEIGHRFPLFGWGGVLESGEHRPGWSSAQGLARAG